MELYIPMGEDPLYALAEHQEDQIDKGLRKVHGGTPLHSRSSLCDSCQRGMVVRGQSLNEEIVHCHAMGDGGTRITFKVTTCTNYTDKRIPSLSDMREIAWELRTDKGRKAIGFVSPAERALEKTGGSK